MATELATREPQATETVVTCETSQGLQIQGTVQRLARHGAVFEVCTPFAVLRVSEALNDFRVIARNRPLYTGRAIVTNLVSTGTAALCEVALDDSWHDVDLARAGNSGNGSSALQEDFLRFIRSSQETFRVLPAFKLVVADMQIFLQDLRLWLEQVELGILAHPSAGREEFERRLIAELRNPVLPMLAMLFDKFEQCSQEVEPALRPAHSLYVKRQLHPLVLCAPFMYRTFRKPLGYPGDYEMVNMMVRDPLEGASLFAKLLNLFFLNTPPVIAHRNRIEYLTGILQQELTRGWAEQRPMKIFNLGCGPAKEIQEFIGSSDLVNYAQFTLLDFNEETLSYTAKVLSNLISRHGRRTSVQMVKKAVAQVLREAAKPNSSLFHVGYDLVYCAGLFDYMPDYISRQLVEIFYRMTAPGGLVVATNVDLANPSRRWMEFSVDWHLIYRDARQMAKLVPESAPSDSFQILSEPTGVNTFLEIRKPKDG